MTFQQMCKDVHMVKSSGQQVFMESRSRKPLRKHVNTGESRAASDAESQSLCYVTGMYG